MVLWQYWLGRIKAQKLRAAKNVSDKLLQNKKILSDAFNDGYSYGLSRWASTTAKAKVIGISL